jgi:hypothetical protein
MCLLEQSSEVRGSLFSLLSGPGEDVHSMTSVVSVVIRHQILASIPSRHL